MIPSSGGGGGAAGVVDLSLPDYAALVAAAGVDPAAEAARVLDAVPAAPAGAGTAFRTAGGELEVSWSQSMNAQQTIGTAFTNNGSEVLDRGTHVAKLPSGFADAGTHLTSASARMIAVADDLTATRTETGSAVTTLVEGLTRTRTDWASRVAAAGTLEGGLIPEADVPGLLAERDRLKAEMETRVGEAGRGVVTRIQAYEGVIHDALRLFADQGFVPVDALDATAPPPPVVAYEGGADPTGFGMPLMAGYAADPVNTALGNFVEVEADLPFTGLLAGLTFSRTYNSRSDRVGPFGARWSSWASVRLVERAWSADHEGPDGQRVSIPRVGAGFGRVVGLSALVERTSDGLCLAWFDGRRWDFDASGFPVRIWAGPGTAVQLRHDDGRLVELVHEGSRRVELEWDGDRIVAVSCDDGRRVTYRYDEAGGLLEASGPAGERHYALDPAGLIASVTDADGVVELRNTYDDDGRVLTQLSPFGRLTTFRYGAETVVADDAAGPTNVYRHDSAGRLVAATDGHGHTQRLRYDAWGNPVEIVARGGGVLRQEFDARARLVRRVLPSGAELVYSHDEADRLRSVTVDGAVTTLRYDGAERTPSEVVDPEGGVTRLSVGGGLVRAITDADGVTVRFRHDRDGHLVEALDAVGGVARIERDAAGRPVATITPAGRRTELTYDARGRLVERRDPAGGVWRHEYSAAGRPIATTDPTGSRTEVRYGEHGEAEQLVDALGAVTARRHDVFGNLTGVTDPGGAKWAYAYDALCRVSAWTDPAGGSWLSEHDADGNLVGAVDPTGVRTTATVDPSGLITGFDDGLVTSGFTHDALGRTTSRIRPDGTAETTTYDRCGRRLTETAPDGGVTRYEWSPAGRLVRIVSPAGREENVVHDACSRAVARVDGTGQRWEQRFDADGLLVERVSPTGLVETLDRDAAGRVVRHRVPGRGTTSTTFDAAGRVVAVADRSGLRRFTHDAAGRVVAATDALGHTTAYAYDERGRLTEVIDPLGGRTAYEHDEVGRVVAETDPLGRTTAYAYDAAGRLREVTEPDGGGRRWLYDASGRTARVTAADGTEIRLERDALARPVRVTGDGMVPVELRWDAAGRLVQRRAGDRGVAHAYDADGLRTALTTPTGSRTSYERDGAGRVVALAHPVLGRIVLDRDADGRLLAASGGGVEQRWRWTDGSLTGHNTTRLTRDDAGRVVVEDTGGRTRRFTYDAAGRLTGALSSGGEWSYRYDAAGRLTGESGPDGERSFTHDAAGQLVTSEGPDGSHSYAYDGSGRRLAQDHRTYDWDAFGRLTGIGGTALQLDALGELAGVGDTPLSWDTLDPSGSLVAAGDVSVIGLGHPWALAGTDGTGRALAPDWQSSVGSGTDPWGGAGPGAGLGFRGELGVEGLVWLRHRAYDPLTRSFLSVDPLEPVPSTAYAGNPYHYAGNDPVNALDPWGLRPMTDADVKEQGGGGWLSKLGHGILDVGGLIPVVGEGADLVNSAWYAGEGDYVNAGLSAAAAVPLIGWGAAGVKGLRYADEAVEATTALTRAEKAAEAVPQVASGTGRSVWFGQARIGPEFSAKQGVPDYLAGRPTIDVVADLKAGRLSPDDIRIEVFEHQGQLVATNNRGLGALSEAGFTPTNISMVDKSSLSRGTINRLDEVPTILGDSLPAPRIAVTPSLNSGRVERVITVPGGGL